LDHWGIGVCLFVSDFGFRASDFGSGFYLPEDNTLIAMTPARIDRLLVTLTAAVLVLWSACLVQLWSYAGDSSGESALLTLAALLVGVKPSLAMASRLVGVARRALRPARQLSLPLGGPPEPVAAPSPRELRILLGAAILLAGVSGLVAMAAVPAGKLATDWLAGTLIWSRSGWLAAGFILRLACLLPMSISLAAAMLAGAMVRQGAGRDAYASVFREWLGGAAAALAAMAAAWWAGANLLAAAMTMPVFLFAAGGAALLRRGVTARPPRPPPREIADLQPPRKAAVGATFAAMAAGLVVQVRLAGDGLGLSCAGCMAWAAVSLAVLTVMLRREDHKAGPPARAREVGELMGLCAAVLMQCSMAILAVSGGAMGGFCAATAVAMQFPLCAFAAGVLSRQRRAHAMGGGSARSYFSESCGGAGAGIACCLLAGWLPGGAGILMGVALGAMAWGACREIFLSPHRGAQVRWACVGSLLLVATTAGLLLAIRLAGQTAGTIEPGTWLSGVSVPSAGGAARRSAGVLPLPLPARSPAITAALAEVLARPGMRGTWWMEASTPEDLPAELPASVGAVFSAPDPSAGSGLVFGPPLHGRTGGAFLQAARIGRERYDGVLLAPMPADHPQAWRCYNEVAMRQAAQCVRGGGPVLLRTQARSPGGEGDALAVASTLLRTVESGWAAVAVRDGWVDVLLGGPAQSVPPPQGREGLLVLSLEDLLAPPFDVPPIRLTSPGGFFRRHPPEGAFSPRRSGKD
jgi:hypothetical protein